MKLVKVNGSIITVSEMILRISCMVIVWSILGALCDETVFIRSGEVKLECLAECRSCSAEIRAQSNMTSLKSTDLRPAFLEFKDFTTENSKFECVFSKTAELIGFAVKYKSEKTKFKKIDWIENGKNYSIAESEGFINHVVTFAPKKTETDNSANENLTFSLTDQPLLQALHSEYFVSKVGDEAKIEFLSFGKNNDDVEFWFQECVPMRWPTCEREVLNSSKEGKKDQFRVEPTKTKRINAGISLYEFKFSVNKSGFFFARVKGSKEIKKMAVSQMKIGPQYPKIIQKNNVLWHNGSQVFEAFNQVELVCEASFYGHYPEINWYNQNGRITNESANAFIYTEEASTYTIKSKLTIQNFTKNDNSKYWCESFNGPNFGNKKEIKFDVSQSQSSSINLSNEPHKPELTIRVIADGKSVECIAQGRNLFNFTMMRNEDYEVKNFSNINRTTHEFSQSILNKGGDYKCSAANDEGVSITKVLHTETPFDLDVFIVGMIIFGLILTIIISTTYFYMKNRRLKEKLKKLGLLMDSDGKIYWDSQSEFEPYDEKLEIPIEEIVILEKLGSGQYGTVFLGIIKTKEDSEKVAVKKVKIDSQFGNAEILISELKIMNHVGKHPNVVNLVGAVTKKLNKGELLIVVEYCEFKSIHSVLWKKSGKKDDDEDSGLGDVNSGGSTLVQMQIDSGLGDVKPGTQLNQMQIEEDTNPSSRNQMCFGVGGFIRRCVKRFSLCTKCFQSQSYSVEPTDFSNISTDREALTYWAYQIACGMEFISSKNVVHRDLAARNVLLFSGNIVKICDFGLAKCLTGRTYESSSNQPLPLRILAPECIKNQEFSQKSDVWAFGLLLWEMFSDGSQPFERVANGNELIKELERGDRPSKPDKASDEIYSIMLECWQFEAEQRPTFTNLKNYLEGMLADKFVNQYKDVSDCYKENGQSTSGYTAMLTASSAAARLKDLYNS